MSNQNFVVKNGLTVGTTNVIAANGAWVGANTNLVGATGPTGVTGATGPTGATGAAATWTRVTSTYTATSNQQIIADTSTGAFTITLPGTPATGNVVKITDGYDWSANNLTVARNGSTIETASEDLVLNIKGVTVELIYDGGTWQVTATIGGVGATGVTGATGLTGATGQTGNTGATGVFSGTTTSQLITSNTIVSTSTSTGALLVSGGAGVTGNIYVGGIVSANNIGVGVTPYTWGAGGYGFRSIDIGNYGAVFGWVTDTRKNVGIACNAYLDSSSAYIYKSTGYASAYRQFQGEHLWELLGTGTTGNTASQTTGMILTTTGKLGIANTSPSSTLTVTSSGTYVAEFNNSSTYSRVVLNGSSGNGGDLIFSSNGVAKYGIYNISGGTSLGFYPNDGGTAAVTFTGDSKVGIGRTDPSSILHLHGLDTTFTMSGTRGTGATHSLELSGTNDDNLCINASTGLYIRTAGSDRAILTSTGLGLGVTPSYKLHVSGTSYHDGSSYFNSGSVYLTDGVPLRRGNGEWVLGYGGSDLSFGTQATSSTTLTLCGGGGPRIHINTNKELILGSAETTNISTDYVNSMGDVSRSTLASYSGRWARFVIQERAGSWISFVNGSAGHYGTISLSGSGVSYGSNSDYRLKENVIDLTSGIAKLKALRPRQFNFINNNETVEGFLAHEVQEVAPYAVIGEKDGMETVGNVLDSTGKTVQTGVKCPDDLEEGHTFVATQTTEKHQSLDSAKLVPILTQALKEAIDKIESLELRLSNIENT